MNLFKSNKTKAETLNELFNLDVSNAAWLDMAFENYCDGNKGSTYRALIMHLVEIFKHYLSFDDEMTMFRFMGFPSGYENVDDNPVIKAIRKKEIALASPTLFNDPMDPLIKVWLKHKQNQAKRYDAEQKMYHLIQKVLDNHVRIGCFLDATKTQHNRWLGRSNKKEPTINDCHPLMWAHYASGHSGICIQYTLSPKTLKVNNRKYEIMGIMDVNYQKSISLEDDISFIDSLTAKGKVWEDEVERRIILFSTKRLDKESEKYYSLKGVEIKAIYMGYSIDDKYRRRLKKIAKEQGYDLYQMCTDSKDITRLVAKKIRI